MLDVCGNLATVGAYYVGRVRCCCWLAWQLGVPNGKNSDLEIRRVNKMDVVIAVLVSLIVGFGLGYAFRGWIHRKLTVDVKDLVGKVEGLHPYIAANGVAAEVEVKELIASIKSHL